MAKPIDYIVTLFPATAGRPARPGDRLFSVQFLALHELPNLMFTATSVEDALAQAEAFALDHGKPCKASLRCLSARKPHGFDAKTKGFGFFNVPAAEGAAA